MKEMTHAAELQGKEAVYEHVSKKGIWRTPIEKQIEPSHGEEFKLPSLTQPNMVESIEVQLERETRGFALQYKKALYTDSDLPIPKLKDWTDRASYLEYVESIKEKIAEANKEELPHEVEEEKIDSSDDVQDKQ